MGYITILASEGKLKVDSPEIKKAMKKFPESSKLNQVVLNLAAKEKKPLKPYLVSSIKAEYHELSLSIGIIKDTYRLKSLFSHLEKTLKKVE